MIEIRNRLFGHKEQRIVEPTQPVDLEGKALELWRTLAPERDPLTLQEPASALLPFHYVPRPANNIRLVDERGIDIEACFDRVMHEYPDSENDFFLAQLTLKPRHRLQDLGLFSLFSFKEPEVVVKRLSPTIRIFAPVERANPLGNHQMALVIKEKLWVPPYDARVSTIAPFDPTNTFEMDGVDETKTKVVWRPVTKSRYLPSGSTEGIWMRNRFAAGVFDLLRSLVKDLDGRIAYDRIYVECIESRRMSSKPVARGLDSF